VRVTKGRVRIGSRLPGDMRATLLVAAALLLLAGVSTFVFADRTDDLFAWTIQPPLTAAFMGAGYWATIALVVLAARAPTWEHARIAFPSTTLFALLVLGATALHFDRFHQGRPITWAWIAIYIAVPVLLAFFGLREARRKGHRLVRTARMPLWALVLLGTQAAVMVPLGVALFAAPETFDMVWPWPLTPLTGRVVGAWLVGLGLGAAHSALERDWLRARPAAATAMLFGALELVALARYSETVDWGDGRTLGYVTMLGFMLALGGVGVASGLAATHEAQARPASAAES
jgi:hypothetical protein